MAVRILTTLQQQKMYSTYCIILRQPAAMGLWKCLLSKLTTIVGVWTLCWAYSQLQLNAFQLYVESTSLFFTVQGLSLYFQPGLVWILHSSIAPAKTKEFKLTQSTTAKIINHLALQECTFGFVGSTKQWLQCGTKRVKLKHHINSKACKTNVIWPIVGIWQPV